MSIDAAGSSTSTAVAAAAQKPAPTMTFDEATELARHIAARPRTKDPVDRNRDLPDTYLVCDVLGKTFAEANTKRRLLLQRIHPDHLPAGTSEADKKVLNTAYLRLCEAWTPVSKSKTVVTRGEIAIAATGGQLADVIQMAARAADTGLRAARETTQGSVRAARAAWQRKVDDGTLERVQQHMVSTANDLFSAGATLLAQGWAAAMKRADKKAPEKTEPKSD